MKHSVKLFEKPYRDLIYIQILFFQGVNSSRAEEIMGRRVLIDYDEHTEQHEQNETENKAKK